MTSLSPLAYGYLRDDLLDAHDPVSSEDKLRTAAASLGYALGTVFREPAPQNGTLPPAFVELVRECRRSEAHTVLTLNGHLSSICMYRTVLAAVLDICADDAVREIEP